MSNPSSHPCGAPCAGSQNLVGMLAWLTGIGIGFPLRLELNSLLNSECQVEHKGCGENEERGCYMAARCQLTP